VLSLGTSVPYLQTLRVAVYSVVLLTLVGQGIGLRILLPRWLAARQGPKAATAGR